MKNILSNGRLIVGAMLSAIYFISCKPQVYQFRGAAVNPIRKAPDLMLTDHSGRKFRLSDQQRRVVLIFFGFTLCPDVCPMTLSKLQKVNSALEKDASSVLFLFVTVDPERDQINSLTKYVRGYGSYFIGLRGSQAELDAVYNAYGIFHEVDKKFQQKSGYLVNHTNSIFVVDKNGNWRLNYTDQATSDDIIQDVRQLLLE